MANPFDEKIKKLSILEKLEIIEIVAGIRKPTSETSPKIARLAAYCIMFSLKSGIIHPGLDVTAELDVQDNPLDNEMWLLSLDEVTKIYHLMLNIPENASKNLEFLSRYCRLYFEETGDFHPRMKIFSNLS